MAEYFLLRNAPITEALIDIRIKIKENFDVKQLISLHNDIKNDYPQKTERRKWEGKVEFKEGVSPISSLTGDTVYGYNFTSADKKQIFQARIDGFTFNRLSPYEKWETFRDEAVRLWKLYKNLVSPDIVRVALRYINKFNIPLYPQLPQDVNEYLAAAPIVPKELPQAISSFLTRVVIPNPDIDASAIITQVFERIIDPKFLPIILDIDVVKQKDKISEEDALQTLEKLRHFKNMIFFASITEKAKELFK